MSLGLQLRQGAAYRFDGIGQTLPTFQRGLAFELQRGLCGRAFGFAVIALGAQILNQSEGSIQLGTTFQQARFRQRPGVCGLQDSCLHGFQTRIQICRKALQRQAFLLQSGLCCAPGFIPQRFELSRHGRCRRQLFAGLPAVKVFLDRAEASATELLADGEDGDFGVGGAQRFGGAGDVFVSDRDQWTCALLRVAFEGMFRRSELIVLRVEDFSVEPDGSGRLFLQRSKTDQEASGVVQYVSPDTVLCVKSWLDVSQVSSGPIFRSTPRSNRADRYDTPLSDRDVARIFKQRALAAGLDPERISGHSTRVGAAQDLLAANFSGAEIMRQGRWKTERMIVRYGENLSAGRGAMARLLRGKKRRDSEG